MPDCRGFLERVGSRLEFCLPRFEREGETYLTVALGCTGGRHRSVVIADQLAAMRNVGELVCARSKFGATSCGVMTLGGMALAVGIVA